MRTLKLTHEQIELLQQALGIAETQFTNVHNNIVETTINVRKGISTNEQNSHAKFYHDMACIFADLNEDLGAGRFDK